MGEDALDLFGRAKDKDYREYLGFKESEGQREVGEIESAASSDGGGLNLGSGIERFLGWWWGVRKIVVGLLAGLGGVGLLVAGGLLVYSGYFRQPEWIVPTGSNKWSVVDYGMGGREIGGQVAGWGNTGKERRYQVMGFLPYWLVKTEGEIQYPVLTQLAYFGLEFEENGELKMYEDDGTAEMGHYRLEGETISQVIRKSRESGVEPVLVIRAMKNDLIEKLLATSKSQAQLVEKILGEKERKHFAGVNIDFEYVGTPPAAVREKFSEFIGILAGRMREKGDGGTLSVDVYADAVRKLRLWEVDKVAKEADYVVMMAYDFHRPSSGVAGPVAPLRGGCGRIDLSGECRWDYDVTGAVADFVEIMPAGKLILGVPYYGYEWQTTGKDATSPTVPQTGALATYKRVREKLAELKGMSQVPAGIGGVGEDKGENMWELTFDGEAMSPTLIYRDRGSGYQRIWYEDEVSLSLKYRLVKQSGLGGVAIWALGYDEGYGELWKVLEGEFGGGN